MIIIQDPSEKGVHNSQSNPNPLPMVLKPVHPKNKDSQYGNICNGAIFLWREVSVPEGGRGQGHVRA